MEVTIPYKYTEQVIPKHCRILRPAQFQGAMFLNIHEVKGKDAPVAIRQHTEGFNDATENYEPVVIDYRWWQGKLWQLTKLQRYSHAPYETQTAEQFATDPYPMSKGTPYYSAYRSKQEQRKAIIAWGRSILFIDSLRWEQAGEPRYVVMTFGLGHNHGHPGTTLSTDSFYNPNIGKSRYFRIDEYEKALETAISTALRRGDDQAVPFIKEHHNKFDILIPGALCLNPQKEHGDGDPFINKLEGTIDASPDALVAGLMVMHEGIKIVEEMGSKTH